MCILMSVFMSVWYKKRSFKNSPDPYHAVGNDELIIMHAFGTTVPVCTTLCKPSLQFSLLVSLVLYP